MAVDKPVKLDGFAPAAGAGAAGPSASTSPGVGSGVGSGTAAAATKAPPPGGILTKRNKRGPNKKGGAAAKNENNTAEDTVLKPLSDVGADFAPLSLPQIQLRLKGLLDKLPKDLPAVPPAHDPHAADATAESRRRLYAPIKAFAGGLQVATEEYNLLLSLVSCAAYNWGVDRSGASTQNLGVLSAELQQCQDVISNVVSARLSNVLCPAVDVLIGEVEIVREEANSEEDGEEAAPLSTNTPAKKRKLNEDRLSATAATNGTAKHNERRINHYTRPLVDPSYVHLCHSILARNAALIRYTVATSIHTAQRVMGDYLKAMKKDAGGEASQGGYY